MKHVTVIDSDTGGFVLVDDRAAHYDEQLCSALNVVMDPDGQTSAVEDYAGQNWAEVLAKARLDAASIAGNRLAVVIAAEGYLYIAVQDEPLTAAEQSRVRSTGRLRLHVPSGTLILSDGMFLFDEEGRENHGEESIGIGAGLYDVAVYGLSPDPGVVPTVGVFGDDESPAVIVRLSKSNAVEDRPIDARVDMSEWVREPEPGAICAATVTKVNGDEAEAAIQLTSHVQSGRARFTVPEDANVGVDDDVWVLLERDEGKYWTVSLIQE